MKFLDLAAEIGFGGREALADDPSFFLFFAATLPHGRFEIDDQGLYKDKDWTEKEKNYAAMVSRLDSDVGRLFDLLKELKVTIRCLRLNEDCEPGTCIFTGKPATCVAVFAKAY